MFFFRFPASRDRNGRKQSLVLFAFRRSRTSPSGLQTEPRLHSEPRQSILPNHLSNSSSTAGKIWCVHQRNCGFVWKGKLLLLLFQVPGETIVNTLNLTGNTLGSPWGLPRAGFFLLSNVRRSHAHWRGFKMALFKPFVRKLEHFVSSHGFPSEKYGSERLGWRICKNIPASDNIPHA